MKKFIPAVMLFLGLQAALFVASVAPLTPATAKFMSGYHMHFIYFFMNTMSLSVVLSHRFVNFRWPIAASFAYSVGVAVAVEIVQKIFTTYRTFDVLDMAFGIAGSLAYCLIAEVVIKAFAD
ncbi:MAG: hypothetical protein HGA85_00665 [Nanoarchaeota archaeon]|nr:hypothetical protein [Nanoarchaeota archaeon]